MSLHDNIITEEESPEIESVTFERGVQAERQPGGDDDCVIIDDAGVLHIRSNGASFHVRFISLN